MTDQPVPRAEPILEQPAQQRFVLGESHHTVANVAWRKDAIFAAQPAGASPVIRNRDDRGEVDDGTFACRVRIMPWSYVQFEAAKERGQSGAAAERYDTNSLLQAS